VRRDPEQHTTLAARLEHEAELALFEVADPTVDEPRRNRRRPAAEVALVDDSRAKASQCRIAGDPGARDPAPDDENVDRFGGQRCECRGARAMGKGRLARRGSPAWPGSRLGVGFGTSPPTGVRSNGRRM